MNYTEIVNLKKQLDSIRVFYLPCKIAEDVENLKIQCNTLLRPVFEANKRELHNSESLQMKWVVLRAAKRFMSKQIGKIPDGLNINSKPPRTTRIEYSTYRYGVPNYWFLRELKNNGSDWRHGHGLELAVTNEKLQKNWHYISSIVILYDYVLSKYDIFLNATSNEIFNLILAAAKNYNNKNTPSYELFESMLIEEFLRIFPNSLNLFTKLFNEYIE